MNYKNNFTSRRRIVDYLRATENEIVVDIEAYDICQVDPDDAGYIPRPTKWLKKIVGTLYFIRLFAFFLRGLWRFGGSTFFHLIELLFYYFYSKKCEDKIPAALIAREYVLTFSSRAADVIQPSVVKNMPKCWITMPWAPINELPSGSIRVDVFSLLNGHDLLKAYLLSVVATRSLSRQRGSSPWVLQSYTAFRWFAVRAAIEKLEGRFLMAEHYDRWAVLADSVVSSQRALACLEEAKKPQLVLVQHGSLGSLKLSDSTPHLSFKLKCRLKAVTCLYVYDQASEEIFKKDILSRHCVSSGVDVNYFSPKITLSPDPDIEGFRILFVGHPICENLHIYLYKLLKREYSMYIYYKPHPTAGMSEQIRLQNWMIVEDRNYYPEVDLLIAYPSTLVREYSTLGVPSVVHSMSQSHQDSLEFVRSLKEKLDNLME